MHSSIWLCNSSYPQLGVQSSTYLGQVGIDDIGMRRRFYGVLGNPNDILSMTRRFGLKQSRFYDLEKCYHLEKQKSLSMSLARESYAKKIRTTPWTKNSRLRVEQLDLSI